MPCFFLDLHHEVNAARAVGSPINQVTDEEDAVTGHHLALIKQRLRFF
jgi:hypothetical protein